MVITSLDFDKPGKEQGFLQVPYSHNLGGWANVMVPITIVARTDDNTALTAQLDPPIGSGAANEIALRCRLHCSRLGLART